MNEMQTAHAGLKKKIVHELIEYWINFGYLAFFLVAFTWYRRLILAEYQVQDNPNGTAPWHGQWT